MASIRAIIEQKVRLRVQREIAEANEKLARLHGIDPDNKDYKFRKRIIRYAFDHHVTVEEARAALAEKRKNGDD